MVLISKICLLALLLLLLRDFIKYLRFYLIVHFKGFLFSFQFIKIILGPIGFEILCSCTLDTDLSQLLPMEI